MKTTNTILSSAVATLAGLLMASAVCNAAIETNPVPGFNSTSGNPATDAHGNQWTACQVVAWNTYSSASDWAPLTKNINHWMFGNAYTSATQDDPIVAGTQYFVECTWDTGIYYNVGLIFKPDVAGTYSWNGQFNYNNYDNHNNPLNVVFGKFDAAGNFTSLLTTSLTSWPITGYNLDLTQVTLQNIVLQAGDSLVLGAKITGGNSQQGDFNLKDASINLVSVVPEPASLALLALGGLALFRRRR